MKIVIGSDHAGYYEKKELIALLKAKGVEIIDVGCFSDASVDYPKIVSDAITEYQKSKADFGILLCGTGIGMSMAANKFGIRAARCCSHEDVKMSREHNDAKFLCMGVRQELKVSDLYLLILEFINCEFSNDERHIRRINLIDKKERKVWK